MWTRVAAVCSLLLVQGGFSAAASDGDFSPRGSLEQVGAPVTPLANWYGNCYWEQNDTKYVNTYHFKLPKKSDGIPNELRPLIYLGFEIISSSANILELKDRLEEILENIKILTATLDALGNTSREYDDLKLKQAVLLEQIKEARNEVDYLTKTYEEGIFRLGQVPAPVFPKYVVKRDASSRVKVLRGSGYVSYPGLSRYKLHSSPAGWINAQAICAAEDAHLLVPNGPDEIYVTTRILGEDRHVKGNFKGPAWIGVRGHQDVFRSVTGENSFLNFRDVRPANLTGCVSTLADGRHVVNQCDVALPFICEKPTETKG